MSQNESNPVASLQKRFKEGCLHHGILFLGNSIQQIEKSALQLVKDILSLRENQAEHPDLFHLRPTGKARIITVDKTRELIATLNRTSNQGGCKVAIVHEADRMRKEAANAFLKTLEEPPPETYLFLLSEKPYSLLATIRSRCLLARLPYGETNQPDEQWDAWKARYQQWIAGLLDRENLKKDRVTPLFAAYGLASSFLGLVNGKSDNLAKQAKKDAPEMDDKELDALEAGVRKGVRTNLLSQLADATHSVVVREEYKSMLPQLGMKLSRVLRCLEKNNSLMEVNLKDDTAVEDFYLSSLRIWSSK
jgi:DNA polymerase-3 subunit delta'